MFLITPITEICKDWVKENVNLESWQWLGDSFAVEHRYAVDLVVGMLGEGLVVDKDFTVARG